MQQVQSCTRLHATTVAMQGRGLLILGRSGAGKSGLALQLMAFGAMLVADDQTEIFTSDQDLMARCPAPLRGMIEARGLGILNAADAGAVPLHLVVDLDQDEMSRLPPLRHITLCDRSLPLVHRVKEAHFAPALLQMLLYGRRE